MEGERLCVSLLHSALVSSLSVSRYYLRAPASAFDVCSNLDINSNLSQRDRSGTVPRGTTSKG